jgi:hypothetical protein
MHNAECTMHNVNSGRIRHEASGTARNVRAMNCFVPCLARADARRRSRFTPRSAREPRVVHCALCIVHYEHQ